MSLLDELQEEVEKRSILKKKRAQIKRLRSQAQEAFNAQFLLNAADNKERMGFLKGRIAAFDECLKVLDGTAKPAEPPKRPTLNLDGE
ncbi:hypothetical protein CSA56_16535 [candidate division KSB3 bacterium]|uniref:Uncharacterized protein n=1 Tax=candidate division KSB3 bacterium TaxID=2044937 RepID=A0A2G6K8T5_9BACT|nr:MAG: hypothetical protein CSA56_16535 [candidate division KSB3 bacterium]